jgi:membrane protein YdbS with pleckstrin-like domain
MSDRLSTVRPFFRGLAAALTMLCAILAAVTLTFGTIERNFTVIAAGLINAWLAWMAWTIARRERRR